jgi:HEPN domain-containing protein
LKALSQRLGAETWGHSLTDLLAGLREKVADTEALGEDARGLDRLYVPTRYPNGWAEGTPADDITEDEASHAIGSAESIVRFCEGRLARS